MSKSRKATSCKNDMVKDALRGRIVEGEFPPGSRLPTLRDLSRQLNLSPVTLQKATHQLTREGFLNPMGSHGTFVSATPPHLCRFALAFPSRPDGVQNWTDWWTILRQAAATIARSDPQKQFVSFYEIVGYADVEDYQRLLADVQARRLAGIIMLSPAYLLLRTPLLDDCPVPRVYIGGDISRWKIPGVLPDFQSFVDRALEHAAGQSRRRPVLLGPGCDIESTWRVWSEACRRHAMEPRRRQLLSALGSRETTRHLTQTLMLLPPEHRPDTLVVADDHFVEEVTVGLLASNLPESELPTVIAHANFPKPPRAHLPVTYLGYDSVGVIRACLDVLEMQRRGQTPPKITPVPAIFASEHSGVETTSIHDSPALREGAAGQSISLHPSYLERRET